MLISPGRSAYFWKMALLKVTQAMREATSFGSRLRALREAQKDGRGWSLEFAAAEIGIAKGSLQSYETGKFPPIDVAEKIVRKYGSDLNYAWYGRIDESTGHRRSSFRLQTIGEVSTEQVRLADLRLERLELLEREQQLASERRKVVDEEIRALEEQIRQRRESNEDNG